MWARLGLGLRLPKELLPNSVYLFALCLFVIIIICTVFSFCTMLVYCNAFDPELQLDTYSNPCSGHVPPALLFYALTCTVLRAPPPEP